MLKRADSPYVSARTDTWLKLKCQQRQEFVVIGFTNRSGAATEVGGLLLSLQTEGPWASYWKSRQTLSAATKAVGQGQPIQDRASFLPKL
jgi:ATP-dependent DNA ligase